jgi:hypothetical protein
VKSKQRYSLATYSELAVLLGRATGYGSDFLFDKSVIAEVPTTSMLCCALTNGHGVLYEPEYMEPRAARKKKFVWSKSTPGAIANVCYQFYYSCTITAIISY